MSGTRNPSIRDRLLDERILLLDRAVDDESASTLVAQLLVLSARDRHSDLTLFVNSPGGSVSAGLAIYDTMQLIPNDVCTVGMGFAASMGQIILCAGAPGKRFALPNLSVVMHEGSAGIGGDESDVAIQAANLTDTLARMRSIIVRHTGRTVDQVSAEVGRDRWFTAEEAKEYGFVDHVVSSIDEVRPREHTRRIGLVGSEAGR